MCLTKIWPGEARDQFLPLYFHKSLPVYLATCGVILWSVNLINIITDKVRSDVMQIMLSFKVVSRVFVSVIYRHKFHNV